MASALSRSAEILCRAEDRLLTLVDLEIDSARAYDDCEQVLVWGQTHELRGRPAPLDENAHWIERLWQLTCAPEIAAACNDRRFALELDRPSEFEFRDVQVVTTLAELDCHLETSVLGPEDSWVAKAPWSASGRERLKRRGRVLAGEQRTFVQKLLSRYGALVVEPWMKRIADFGVAGIVGDHIDSSLVFPAHRLHCDAGGVFRGIRIDPEGSRALLGSHQHALAESANQVLGALHQRGYRGPFGIDAFLYDEGGASKLRAVCEINARITFGHVAWATAEAAGTLTCDFAPGC